MTNKKMEKLNKVRVTMYIVGAVIMLSAVNELENTVAWWWIIGAILCIPLISFSIFKYIREEKEYEKEKKRQEQLKEELKKIDAEIKRLSNK